MCGITGVAGSLRAGAAPGVLERMNGMLRHRGPDGDGFFWDESVGLAMRRLAIIDVAGGDQPIFNEDGSVCVVFNGEIYNFQDLRVELEAKGHRFSTGSDTEVIVHLYEEAGEACVERLWGMFALAVWDSRNRTLLVARDRLGEKPLVYFASADGGLAFASELQALFGHPSVPREVDARAIDDYLTYLYVPAPRTAYRGVRKLPPGHRLVWRDGKTTVEAYWRPRFAEKQVMSEEEATDQFGVLFRDAVRRRLIADVPLGAFLSGGMDSSSVVAEMAELSSAPVKTFSIGFGERDFDELAYARQVAERFATDHHELVVEPRALEILPRLAQHYGEPYGDSSAVPTYYVAQMTRAHVTVALDGNGGDELLAGYERHWAARLAARYDAAVPRLVRDRLIRPLIPLVPEPRGRRALLRRAKRFFAAAHLPVTERYLRWVGAYGRSDKASLYTEEFRRALAGNDSGHWLRGVLAEEADLDPVDAVQRADTLMYLPDDLLAKVDIATMANSLEARPPFLDHRLVEFCASLPSAYKLRGRTSKLPLRRLMRNRLPPAILSRSKMGFGVPVGEWLRGDLRPLLEDTVLSDRALTRGYFRPDAVRSLIEEHLSRRADRPAHVWALLMLELWFRAFVDEPVAPAAPASAAS